MKIIKRKECPNEELLLLKVAKFGGSSVANAEQIKKVSQIIQEDSDRKFIVVSAPGKQDDQDQKMTDLLLKLGDVVLQNKPFANQFDQVMQRFSAIINDLNLPSTLYEKIRNHAKQILQSSLPSDLKLEAIKSIGEDGSARILSAYLNTQGLQATYINPKDAGIIVSNDPGNAQILPESYAKIYALREKEGILIIPGFFGYTTNDEIITFSRGGSDITGSIIAAGVKANLYENFTDVDSVYTVNPSIVENPKKIKKLTYREMRELSYAGFSVFHDEALIPAFREKIPVCIKNTNNPSAPGTMIVSEREPDKNCVVGIASDTGFYSLYVSKYLMNRQLGFGRKLLHILEDESVSFEHAPSGIDDISIIIRENQLTDEKKENILRRINDELKPDTVSIQDGLALIMVVGEGMASTVGIAHKATKAFKKANVNIDMINQGSSEVSMMFGIRTEHLTRAVRSLYDTFFATE